MKKIKFIAVAIISLITISSCTVKENYHAGNWFVKEILVKENNWKLVGRPNAVGSYYEYIYTQLPLDNTYYFDGITTVYMFDDYTDPPTPSERQAPLPRTFFEMDGDIPFSIQYTYELTPNSTIIFKAYISDYYTGDFRPGTEMFKVSITW